MRVAITDKHPVARLGVRIVLASAHVGHIEWEASSAQEMLRMVESNDTDLLIVDCHTLGGDIECAEHIRAICEHRLSVPVIALTSNGSRATAISAIDAGARFTVCKGAPPSKLITACRKVLRGDHHEGAALPELTKLEAHVFKLLSDGKSITEVSRAMGRPTGAVSRIKTNAMKKAGVSNNLDLHALLRSRIFTE